MDVASLGFRTDLSLLRLGGTTIEERGDHLVVRSSHNPSHWWGNFLLLHDVPTPASSPGWLDRFAATFPDARHVALGFDGTHGALDDLAWFAARGFTADAQAVMTTSIVHEPRHPNPDAECRTLRTDEDWVQSVDLEVRSIGQELDRAGFRAFAAAKAVTNRRLVEAGHGAWFGAFADGRLVCQMGLVTAGPGLARFQTVHTDPGLRRQGFAGTLVHHAGRFGFDTLGARTLVMVADPGYVAIELYRAVGFEEREVQLQIERPPATG
ncbi:MAG TPA: GNAT family N-acetyltransferase [Acidimicrobiales bacterium]|nr:GNAT family N-acetyltransferase [Acidimicrobiales bacterium]